MLLRSVFRAALAASLVISPVVATAQAEPPPVAVSAPDDVEGSSQLAGDYSPLIAIGLLAVIIVAAFVLSDDENSSSP